MKNSENGGDNIKNGMRFLIITFVLLILGISSLPQEAAATQTVTIDAGDASSTYQIKPPPAPIYVFNYFADSDMNVQCNGAGYFILYVDWLSADYSAVGSSHIIEINVYCSGKTPQKGAGWNQPLPRNLAAGSVQNGQVYAFNIVVGDPKFGTTELPGPDVLYGPGTGTQWYTCWVKLTIYPNSGGSSSSTITRTFRVIP